MVIGVVRCPKCLAEIGRVVNYKERPYLDDGVMLVLIGLRRCHCCGRVFYWNGEQMDLVKAAAEYGNGHQARQTVGAW